MKNHPLFSRRLLICTTVLASALHVGQAQANQAVSAPNATLDVAGGVMEGDATGVFSGIADLPVGEKFGAQIDTLYRKTEAVDAGGLAGHFFYRDPQSYLVGATVLWYTVEGRDVYRYGAETEFYYDKFTVGPSFGIQEGDANNGYVGYYDLDVSYYLTENLRLMASGTGFSGTHGGYAEVEWQPENEMPLTVYASLGDSNDTRTFGLIGMRFNFGAEGQSLRHRHRYSDPENILHPLDNLVGNSFVNNNRGGAAGPSPSPCPGAC